MPGFISWLGVTVGDRMMTITAWESADAVEPLMKGGEHRSAPRLLRGRFVRGKLCRVRLHTGRQAAHLYLCRRSCPRECDALADIATRRSGRGQALRPAQSDSDDGTPGWGILRAR